jgi:hypothetical protein
MKAALNSTQTSSKNTKAYKNVISPAVLYGPETWSLTLRKEYELRVLNNNGVNHFFNSN